MYMICIVLTFPPASKPLFHFMIDCQASELMDSSKNVIQSNNVGSDVVCGNSAGGGDCGNRGGWL